MHLIRRKSFWIATVTLGGLAALALLFCFPPWEIDGRYAGHSSLFRTAFMHIDSARLATEATIIFVVTVIAVAAVARCHKLSK